MKHKGFTLIELMVAVFVFSLITGGALNLLLSSMKAQKQYLSSQRLYNQSSFAAEYMARALRQARKELTSAPNNCLTTVGRGYNYQIAPDQKSIRFLDKNSKCHEFFLTGTDLRERISSNALASGFPGFPGISGIPFVSADFPVQSVKFSAIGENQTDVNQPRATFSFMISGMEFQTTVSQRNFDVQQ